MERLKQVGFGILCFAFCGLFVWLWGADLYKEFTHRNDTFVQAADMRLVEGKCKSRLFVISACDVKLRNLTTGKESEQNYFMLGNYGGSSVSVLRSARDQSFVTTSMGRDQLWNRALLTLAPILLFGVGGLALIGKAARG